MEKLSKERSMVENSYPRVDARLKTPFNMIVSGPTGAGKSTFVEALLNPEIEIFSDKFKYILIFIGTSKSKNPMALSIQQMYGHEKCLIFDNVFSSIQPQEFSEFLEKQIELMGGSGGLMIFDDLMVELGESGVLLPLFTRISSHYNVSNIHITQNLFHKVGGKNSGNTTTIYRNTTYLVLFHSPMDKSTVDVVARKLSPKCFRELAEMINHVCAHYRYILIDGRQDTPEGLRYRTTITGDQNTTDSRTVSSLLFQRAFVL